MKDNDWKQNLVNAIEDQNIDLIITVCCIKIKS